MPFPLRASVHLPQYCQRHLQAQASQHSAIYAPSYLLVPAGIPLLTFLWPCLICHVALLLGLAPCAVRRQRNTNGRLLLSNDALIMPIMAIGKPLNEEEQGVRRPASLSRLDSHHPGQPENGDKITFIVSGRIAQPLNSPPLLHGLRWMLIPFN